MKKAKRKRCIKSDEQEDSSLSSDQVSNPVKVVKDDTKCVVKEEITAKVSTAANNNRNRECKQSAKKRKRASSADAPESVQSHVDSDTLPSQKRKTAVTSVQNEKPLWQDKPAGQSLDSRQPSMKQRQPTRMRKSAPKAEEKKASKEPSQKVLAADRKKSTKVKGKSVSPVDKTSVKIEKPDVAFMSPSYHSGRKYIGAHVSISGM